VSTSGGSLTTQHDGLGFLTNTNSYNGQIDPNSFFKPNLLGGSVEWDVNLSEAGCNCSASVYMVDMPAKTPWGSPNPSTGGDYYCDANSVSGAFCPEVDLMEANKYAFQLALHKCAKPASGTSNYPSCDPTGDCKIKFNSDKNKYGPSGEYKINTNSPFHVKVEFIKGKPDTGFAPPPGAGPVNIKNAFGLTGVQVTLT